MDIDNEELCLLHNGSFVNITKGCDSFDADDVAMHTGNPLRRTCWNKDLKGFHPCNKKETDFVQLLTYGDTVHAEVKRNLQPMKYESGIWKHSEFIERTRLLSDTLFWG